MQAVAGKSQLITPAVADAAKQLARGTNSSAYELVNLAVDACGGALARIAAKFPFGKDVVDAIHGVYKLFKDAAGIYC